MAEYCDSCGKEAKVSVSNDKYTEYLCSAPKNKSCEYWKKTIYHKK